MPSLSTSFTTSFGALVFSTALTLAAAEPAKPKPQSQPEDQGGAPDTRLARPAPNAKPALSQPPAVGPALQLQVRPLGVSVSPETSHNLGKPGEVTSTVVPPSKNSSCPGGRLIISDDSAKSPGRIKGYDLGQLDAMATNASIDPVPNVNWRILSNDHDVVTLPDGSILYLRMGQGRSALRPKPDWFDTTFKLQKDKSPWGPGARSIIMVWRSDDCGATFKYRSAIDMATVNDDWGTTTDGSAALPQPADGAPPYQMGGTDGSLAKVDWKTGRVFYTMGVVGREPSTQTPDFTLTTSPVQRTVVMMSDDRGDSWEETTVLRFRGWRTEVVPLPGNQLAFAAFGAVGSGHRSFVSYETVGHIPGPNVATSSFTTPVEEGAWGWDDKPDTAPMSSGIPGQTILTRSPSSQAVLLAYRDTIDNGGGYGYGLYVYGPGGWTPFGAFAPRAKSAKNIVFHLTPIDLGSGPVLYYWYDVDFGAQTASIWGRLITSDTEYTADFLIGETFDINPGRWYGHYHTAGGYVARHRAKAPRGERPEPRYSYDYFPIWIEPDGLVHSARVKYEPPEEPASTLQHYVRAGGNIPALQPVNTNDIRVEVITDNP